MTQHSNADTYVDQAAQLIGLPIPPDYHPDVVENFDRIAAIAQLVLEFPIPETTELAPRFEP
jgi:hypothetical protein